MTMLPSRKKVRLEDYDYSENGVYFVTVCTTGRAPLLSSIRVGDGLCAVPSIELTPIGIEVERSIRFLEQHYSQVTLEKYVIMPNHIHLLLGLYGDLSGGDGTPPLHSLIGRMKSFTTKAYGKTLWQRSFYDRIVRNEQEFQAYWQYIEYNPLKWEEDVLHPLNMGISTEMEDT